LDRSHPLVSRLSRTYSAALNVLYGRSGVDWCTNGEHIRIDPRFRGKIQPANETEVFALLKNGIKPGQIIFDVGTFIGTYAVFEARWSGPTGRVIAFEPTAMNWPRIQAHLRMNGVEGRVDLIKAAAGATSGRTQFNEHHRDSDQNSVFPLLGQARSRSTEVPMVTLDEISMRLNVIPDWIRIDVQGFELSVLRGARRILGRAPASLRIVVEMHPSIWTLQGFGPREVGDGLRELGLTAQPIMPGTDPFADGHVELIRG